MRYVMMDTLTLHHLLVESGTRHEIVHLPRAISVADQLPDVLRLPHSRCIAVRMYEADGTLTAVIVHAGNEPSITALRELTGSRFVTSASGHRVNSVTGYAAGLVAPVGLPDSVDVYADEDVVRAIDNDVVVYTATGESGTALGIRLLDLFTLRDAKAASLTTPRREQHVPATAIASRRVP